jgi:hypothetical protein
MRAGQMSRTMFCPACGAPAIAAVPPGGAAYWRTSCTHALQPMRMHAQRRAEVVEAWGLAREAERRHRRQVIADCEGRPL